MSFQTTRWSLVLRARRPDADGARALDELLGAYWQPVYVLYRRLGATADDAADLTQGLFARLLARGDLDTVAPDRGRFRDFLRSCARHWWANERERAAATKRGGGVHHVSFDRDGTEAWLSAQPADGGDAAALFERRWAQTVLDRALWRLEQEEVAAGRGAQFAQLSGCLAGSPPPEPWSVIAHRIGTSEGALRVAAHRLRVRFRACVVTEVRETLPDDCAPGDELQELLAALQSTARGANSRESR